MENLAPPLILISHIKRSIEVGSSVRFGINQYLNEGKDEFSVVVRRWFFDFEKGYNSHKEIDKLKSRYRKALLLLLERGLNKESIYPQLLILEQETIESCQHEIGEKLTKLPYILMIPVLFFQFPALLLLILGPLIQNFIESLK